MMMMLLLSCGWLHLLREASSAWRLRGFKAWVKGGLCGVARLSWVVLLRLGLMLQVIVERNEHRLPVGQHDGVTRLLLETADFVFNITQRLRRMHSPAGNSRALPVDVSGSLDPLREIQGGKRDLLPHPANTLTRGSEAANDLLHLGGKPRNQCGDILSFIATNI